MKKNRVLRFCLYTAVIMAAPLLAAWLTKSYPEKIPDTDIPVAQETKAAPKPSVTSLPEPVSYGFGDNWDEFTLPPSETAAPEKKDPINAGPLPYPESIENKSGKISRLNYSNLQGIQIFNLENGGQVRNCTKVLSAQLGNQSKLMPDYKIKLNAAEPQVMLVHTHTTESYEPYARDFFDASFNSRTTDGTKNMVMVGSAIAQQLEAAGISVLHDTTIHDYPSYNGSYARSADTVSAALKKYPSIKIVLDIHRDAISDDSTRYAPVTEIDGRNAAQIMIISCCDDGSGNIPNYTQNFRLASLIQQQAEKDYPGFTRPILFDYRGYNQNLSPGSLLIEVGASANSLDEAEYAGILFGKTLANSLKKIT